MISRFTVEESFAWAMHAVAFQVLGSAHLRRPDRGIRSPHFVETPINH